MKRRIKLHASMTPPTELLTVRDLEARDRKHGYSSVGYHYIIRRSGQVDVGRTSSQPSLHDDADGAETLSICLVGGADNDGAPEWNFTAEQVHAATVLIAGIWRNLGRIWIGSATDAIQEDHVFDIEKLASQP